MEPIKVYLAAKFSRRAELENLSKDLKENAMECVARWVYGGEEGLSREEICMLDLEDVQKSDMIVLFTHPRGESQPGGGRFVEFGYAMALGKELIVIGPEENVFMTHPSIRRYDSWNEFLISE